MSTAHHQVVGKCNISEACEFTGENTLGRETLSFAGNVAPGVAAESAPDSSESPIGASKRLKTGMPEHFCLEDQVGKMFTTL